MKVTINAETEQNLETLKNILSQKLGRAATLSEVVAWATNVTYEEWYLEKMAESKEA